MTIEEIKQGVSIHPNSTAPACIGLNEQMNQEQLEYEEFQKSLSIKDEFIISLMTTSQRQKYGNTLEGIEQFCKERLGK